MSTHAEFRFPDEEGEDTTIEIEGDSSQPVMPDPDGAAGEIEIEIAEEKEEAPAPKAEGTDDDISAEELSSYSDKVQARINKLTKKFRLAEKEKAEEARQRAELEAVARRLADENKQLKGSTHKTQTALVEQAKRAVLREIDDARAAYKAAYEAGNSDELLKAEEALDTARRKQERINGIKLPALQEETDGVQIPPEAPRAPAPAKVDDRAAQWAEANPWFGKDMALTGYALGLHQTLVDDEGIDPQSDVYYSELNARIKRFLPASSDDEKPSQDGGRPPATVVAPATRTRAPNKVVLTPTQVAVAKRLGISLQDYARQMIEDARKNNG